jgi:cytochrome c-type biogenesis protein CcmH
MKTRNFFQAVFFLLIFALAVVPAVTVLAQQPTPSDDDVNAIAGQLFCPICENIPLDVCPTQACHDWRELIRQMLLQGKSTNEIKQYFVDHYGARVLAVPPRTGLNWLIYVFPPLAILLGLFLLFRAFRIWKKMSKKPSIQAITAPEPATQDDYAARLEDELRKRN